MRYLIILLCSILAIFIAAFGPTPLAVIMQVFGVILFALDGVIERICGKGIGDFISNI